MVVVVVVEQTGRLLPSPALATGPRPSQHGDSDSAFSVPRHATPFLPRPSLSLCRPSIICHLLPPSPSRHPPPSTTIHHHPLSLPGPVGRRHSPTPAGAHSASPLPLPSPPDASTFLRSPPNPLPQRPKTQTPPPAAAETTRNRQHPQPGTCARLFLPSPAPALTPPVHGPAIAPHGSSAFCRSAQELVLIS